MPELNDQTFWFKQRYYFWQPITWQGYATVIGFLLVALGNILVVLLSPCSNQLLWLYLNALAMALTTLLLIGRAKGPGVEDIP
jgi:hypothetical protein